jgi:hypothetical protein
VARRWTRLGISGTRDGFNEAQFDVFKKLVRFFRPDEFHHGDCIGVDEQAHNYLTGNKIAIYIHPPLIDRYRAFCDPGKFGIIEPPRTYRARNVGIVRISNIMCAFPGPNSRGTYHAIGYAKKIGCPIYVCGVDGNCLFYI